MTIIKIMMTFLCFHIDTCTIKAGNRPTTLATSRQTAEQLNTDRLSPLQPHHNSPRYSQIHPVTRKMPGFKERDMIISKLCGFNPDPKN
jgi:hypothetical protein